MRMKKRESPITREGREHPASPSQLAGLKQSLKAMKPDYEAWRIRRILGKAAAFEESEITAIIYMLRSCGNTQPTTEDMVSWGQWLYKAVANDDMDAFKRMLAIMKLTKEGRLHSTFSLKELGIKSARGKPVPTITNKMVFCAAATWVVSIAIQGNYLPSRKLLRQRINHERKALGLPKMNFQSWERELQEDITHYGLKGLLCEDNEEDGNEKKQFRR